MSTAPHGPTSITMTIFANASAQTKREEAATLSAWAELIARANAPSKDKLSWLKMAFFGGQRTEGGSLRNNSNVITITGLEADYDGEAISFDQAVETLSQAELLSIVYTSPSHTEDTPRWRVLCPFSKEHLPVRRDAFLARLNGLFGGVFAPESWVLSQSYYYGCVAKNPSHRAQLIDGTAIDLRPDLDATAIGNPRDKPADASARPISNGAVHGPVSDKRLEKYRLKVLDHLRREAFDGQKHYALLRHATALGGIQADCGFSDETAVQWMMDALPDTVENWRLAERTAKDGLARGRAQPIELEERPYSGNGASGPFTGAYHPASDPPPTKRRNPRNRIVRARRHRQTSNRMTLTKPRLTSRLM